MPTGAVVAIQDVTDELQKEQELTRQFEIEWGQLQLEQSTWATNKRIEAVASRSLGMRVPDPTTTVVVTLEAEKP